MEDNIKNLNFHPQLRHKGTPLFIGKLTSLLLIISSLFYWVTFISGKADYQLLLGTGILLYSIYFLCLFFLTLYLRNFKLHNIRIWIYLIMASYIFLFAVSISGIIMEIIVPLQVMTEYELADNISSLILAILVMVFVLGCLLLLLTGHFVAGIGLISFKGDFVGGLKSFGILMVVFPMAVILSYVAYFVMSYIYITDTFTLKIIYSVVLIIYVIEGILLFRIFHKASEYNNDDKEEVV